MQFVLGFVYLCHPECVWCSAILAMDTDKQKGICPKWAKNNIHFQMTASFYISGLNGSQLSWLIRKEITRKSPGILDQISPNRQGYSVLTNTEMADAGETSAGSAWLAPQCELLTKCKQDIHTSAICQLNVWLHPFILSLWLEDS